jgi:WD40 repeat protein
LLVSNHRSAGVIPAAGGTVQPIERPYTWVQMLPDGRHFLFTTHDRQLRRFRARVATVGANDDGIEVAQADSRVQYASALRGKGGYLLYLRAGTLLAQPFDAGERRTTGEPKAIVRRVSSFGPTGSADFSVSQRGVLAYQTQVARSEFIWVDRKGNRLSVVSPPDITANHVRLSPDGRWLASATFDAEHGVPEIWLYDAANGAGRRILFGEGVIRSLPVWSPDSRRLVYLSDENWPRLALASTDGKPDEEPLPETGFMVPSDWSTDGRFVLYTNAALPAITSSFPSDVFAIDMARGRKVIPLLQTRFHEAGAVFSPDGNWVAFLSNESGKGEAYVQRLDRSGDSLRVSGERVLLSRDGAQCLRWRKDGRELFYLGSDGRVYAVRIALRPDRVDVARPEPLFPIDPESRASVHSIPSFDVSSDGSRFVVPSMVPGESSTLVVLQNWETLIK